MFIIAPERIGVKWLLAEGGRVNSENLIHLTDRWKEQRYGKDHKIR